MKTFYTYLACLLPCILAAQAPAATATNDGSQEAAKATEFAIPAAPAYMLLDASSPLVNQPANVRDFKVDWSLRSYALQPNIALEAQPIWEIFYNKSDISKYQKTSKFMRTLSTLSLSGGTLQKNVDLLKDSVLTTTLINQASIAFKINLYRQYDPLMDVEIYKEPAENYVKQKADLEKQVKTLTDSLPKVKTPKAQKEIEKQIQDTKTSLIVLNNAQKEIIKGLRTQYVKEHWNAAMLDVAFGKVYNFDRPVLDSLNLVSSGFGIWLNGSYGIGKKSLLCGTLRYTKMDTIQAFEMGVNYRYGSPKYNFFVETVYKPVQSDNNYKNKFVIAYGGDFKVGNNVAIGFALRTVYDKNLQFTNLVPVANINCLMR